MADPIKYDKLFTPQNSNIFPMANSTQGGQLVTEYNLKSRESVTSDLSIPYSGHSFCKTINDFELSGSGSVLTIGVGSAVIDGHYVELLSATNIDVSDLELPDGTIYIGLRINYINEDNFDITNVRTGAIQPELTQDDQLVYPGVSVVFSDSLFDISTVSTRSAVVYDLYLGSAQVVSGSFVGTNTNTSDSKIQCLDASRISGLSSTATQSDDTAGASEKLYYVYNGKTGWCDASTNLINWGPVRDVNENIVSYIRHPQIATGDSPYDTANAGTGFVNIDDEISLRVSHKTIDSPDESTPVWKDNYFKLPTADYFNDTAGVVNSEYTSIIKSINRRLSDLQLFGTGHCLGIIDSISDVSELPGPPEDSSAGDYIVVLRDTSPSAYSQYSGTSEYLTTVYMLQGHIATRLSLTNVADASMTYPYVSNKLLSPGEFTFGNYSGGKPDVTNIYAIPKGMRIAQITDIQEAFADYSLQYDAQLSSLFNTYWDPNGPTPLHGSLTDYVVFRYTDNTTNVISYYYAIVAELSAATPTWSSPIVVNGQAVLATTASIGGFYNTEQGTTYNAGYVGLDDSGRLRLWDYNLLAQGTLAYQLCESNRSPIVIGASGMSAEDIQADLTDSVNERIMFPAGSPQSTTINTSGEYVVQWDGIDPETGLYISDNAPAYTADQLQSMQVAYNYVRLQVVVPSEGTIEIRNIDSRFGTYLDVTLVSDTSSTATVRFSNIEKLKVNVQNMQAVNTNLEFVNCNIYYDPALFGMTNCTFVDARIWSDQIGLHIDGLHIIQEPFNNYAEITDLSDADSDATVDMHLGCALRGLTYNSQLEIIGADVAFQYLGTAQDADSTLSRIYILDSFKIPQGSILGYDEKCMIYPLHFDGSVRYYYNAEDIGIVCVDLSIAGRSYYQDDSQDSVKFICEVNAHTCQYGGSADLTNFNQGTTRVISGYAI